MIPLLKTANIELVENVMTITTTAFCQSKCLENTIYQVLENAAHFFHADTLHVLSSDAPVQTESTEDIARSIFND